MRRALPWLAVLALAGVGIWFSVGELQWQLLRERVAALADRQALEGRTAELVAENQRLAERLVRLERSAQVDKQSYDQLQEHVRVLRERLGVMADELQFYRTVLDKPGAEAASGPQLQSLSVERGAAPERYAYRLVLTRFEEGEAARGRVALLLDGTENGQASQLELASMLESGADALEFDFNHFTRMAGSFRLPAGFRPSRLRVRLELEGGRSPAVEKSFDWGRLLN